MSITLDCLNFLKHCEKQPSQRTFFWRHFTIFVTTFLYRKLMIVSNIVFALKYHSRGWYCKQEEWKTRRNILENQKPMFCRKCLCVLGKLLSFSEPQFSHWFNEIRLYNPVPFHVLSSVILFLKWKNVLISSVIPVSFK